jgi:hypothetical protein
MNERISQLIKQSYVTIRTPSGEGSTYFSQEKFAELIVEEMYVFMCNATDNDKPWPTFKEVKQHFGVEE